MERQRGIKETMISNIYIQSYLVKFLEEAYKEELEIINKSMTKLIRRKAKSLGKSMDEDILKKWKFYVRLRLDIFAEQRILNNDKE